MNYVRNFEPLNDIEYESKSHPEPFAAGLCFFHMKIPFRMALASSYIR